VASADRRLTKSSHALGRVVTTSKILPFNSNAADMTGSHIWNTSDGRNKIVKSGLAFCARAEDEFLSIGLRAGR
jgi:hypothetical protein